MTSPYKNASYFERFMPFVNTSRTFLFLAVITNLLAISGGGSILPPFKTFAYFKTSSAIVGIYGTCPMNFDPTFHALDSNWQELQGECKTMFTTFDSSPARLSPRDEIMISGLHLLGLLFTLIALGTYRKRNTISGTLFSFAATIVQAIGVGLALYQFWTFQDQGQFGYGMYADCATVLFLLIASVISIPRRTTFEKWSA
jgi:hypothetical protein